VLAITTITGGVYWMKHCAERDADAIVQVKVPPNLSLAAKSGKQLFEKNCSVCHGMSTGGSSNGPPLIHRLYEPNHHSDVSFVRAANNGVRTHHWPFGNMPPVKDVTQENVKLIITYVRALQRANGIY